MGKIIIRDGRTRKTYTYSGDEAGLARVRENLDSFLETGTELCVRCLLEKRWPWWDFLRIGSGRGVNVPATHHGHKPSGGPIRGLCERHYLEENR